MSKRWYSCVQCRKYINPLPGNICIECILLNGEKECSICYQSKYLQSIDVCYDCKFDKKDTLNIATLCHECLTRLHECRICDNYTILWQDDICSLCLKKNGVKKCRYCNTIVGISDKGICLYCDNIQGDLSDSSEDLYQIRLSRTLSLSWS